MTYSAVRQEIKRQIAAFREELEARVSRCALPTCREWFIVEGARTAFCSPECSHEMDLIHKRNNWRRR